MSEQERDFLTDYAEEDGKEAPETEVKVEEAETPESEAAKVEKQPETATKATTAEEPYEEQRVPVAALKAERQKRQDLERKLAELSKSAEPKQPQTFWEDPDGFVNSRVQQVEAQAHQRFLVAVEEQARSVHKDYDEVIERVKEYMAENPAVVPQIMGAANPAAAAYKLGKQLDELKQMQDPEAYRERVRAEIRAELAKEAEGKSADSKRNAESIPPDLSAARNVSATNATEVPDPFVSLFPRK